MCVCVTRNLLLNLHDSPFALPFPQDDHRAAEGVGHRDGSALVGEAPIVHTTARKNSRRSKFGRNLSRLAAPIG